MKNGYVFLIGTLMVECMAGRVAAQVPMGITDVGEYDAWKMQFVPPEAQGPARPTALAGGARDGGPCSCWIMPDASWTTISNANPNDWDAMGYSNGDDGSLGPVALPFSFQFYGTAYDSVFININGNISFGTAYGSFSAVSFPSSSVIMLAPFWADVDLRVPGEGLNTVQYKVAPTALYVSWTNVGYYNQQSDKLNSFQLIITNGTDTAISGGNNVSFCYGSMQWTTGSASGGLGGFGGTPATVGANRGDGLNYLQFGRFDHPGDAYDGPFGNLDGVGWLTDRHFAFSTESAVIPPIFTTAECDTLEMEVGSSFDYPMLILPGGAGQTTLSSAESPTFFNFTTSSTVANGQLHLVLSLHPQAGDVGVHAITVTAGVEGSEAVSHYVVYVKVLLSTGIEKAGTADGLSLAPNPAMDRAILTWPAGQQPVRVEVFAMNGALVLAQTPVGAASQMELDLSGLPDGIYTVRATGAVSTSTVRLVRSSAQ